MNNNDLLLIGGLGLAAFAFYGFNKKPAVDAETISTGAGLPSYPDIPIREPSELRGEDWLNLRTEEDGEITTYPINVHDLSAPEQRAIQRGFYDIEDDMIQYGVFQGAERKLRDIGISFPDINKEDVVSNYWKYNPMTAIPAWTFAGAKKLWDKGRSWIGAAGETSTTPTVATTPTETKAEQRTTRSAEIQKSASTITRISRSSRRKVAEAAQKFEEATTTKKKKSAIEEAWKAAGL